MDYPISYMNGYVQVSADTVYDSESGLYIEYSLEPVGEQVDVLLTRLCA